MGPILSRFPNCLTDETPVLRLEGSHTWQLAFKVIIESINDRIYYGRTGVSPVKGLSLIHPFIQSHLYSSGVSAKPFFNGLLAI